MGLTSSKSTIASPATFVTEALAANKVVVFSKSYCPSCSATKRLLTSLNIDFDVHELDKYGEPRNGPVQQHLRTLTGNITTPQVFSFSAQYIGSNSDIQRMNSAGTLLGKLQAKL